MIQKLIPAFSMLSVAVEDNLFIHHCAASGGEFDP